MADPFIGHITMFTGIYIPRGYAECNGQLMEIRGNESLFSLLGNQFGGDGVNTFALPDYRGRVPVGVGAGPGIFPIPRGERGGVETVTLTVDNLPNHTHTMAGSNNDASSPEPAGNLCAVMDESASPAAYNTDDLTAVLPGDTMNNSGGDLAHSNMMPYMTVRFIIATQGVYPSRS